ncbi:MAG: efflux transporter periplasmic adaptor subunit, partial [Rhodocyclaceae bacterium]|nr:efflux transporter periplasmic adaptor subunit [Rhodocyclaceae bacterium]
TAQVFIIAAQAKDALSIPSSALGAKDADGLYEVRVLARGAHPASVETRKVEIGLNNRVDAQVLGGLQEGDTVLLNAPRADANAAPQARPPRMRL